MARRLDLHADICRILVADVIHCVCGNVLESPSDDQKLLLRDT